MKLKVMFVCIIALVALLSLASCVEARSGLFSRLKTLDLERDSPVNEFTVSPSVNSYMKITNIRFGFKKIIATVKNTGSTYGGVDLTFSVSKPPVLPIVIGRHIRIGIPPGAKIDISQRFTGRDLGRGYYIFYVRDDFGAGSEVIHGYWFGSFGIKLWPRIL